MSSSDRASGVGPRASALLSRAEIRALTQRSNAWGLFAIAWSWILIAGVFAALARWPHPLVFVAAVILLGGRQLALAVLMHESAHGTLFRTRRLDVLADWLCARPVWADIARYRAHHLAHHAHTGTERDPDLSLALARPMSRRSLARKIGRDLVGATGAKRVLGLVLIDAELLSYNVGGAVRRLPWRGAGFHVRAAARALWRPALANAAMLGVLAALGCAWVYAAWAIAYVTTFSLWLRWRSLAEHALTERGADPLRNTRTTRAGVLARLTVAPYHVNYHLEHHLLPTVPWFRLPALARLLSARNAVPAASRARSYVDVLRQVTRGTAR